jgi:23S rRNA (cytidine2498-2'-O)-methyltransferase
VPNSLIVFCCEIGWETAVADELNRVFSGGDARLIADGWVGMDGSAAAGSVTPTVALALQCLPDARQIEAISITEYVRSVGERIIQALREHTGPWRLHVFGIYAPAGQVARRRAALIELGIIELLRKRQRRLLRTMSPGERPFDDDDALVQIGLVTPRAGFSSFCLPGVLRNWRHCLSPFADGCVNVPQDRKAPSRAFAKLVEAEIRLGRRIAAGDTVVDLGASPGSWSYVALKRGANVTAVDRSPLRADLMKHPRLTFVRGDAFRFEPLATLDWLLCDVIAFPDRILALLNRWLSERWCRSFCVTIKFRGRGEYAVLEEFKRMLEASGYEFLLRRLTSNKNEATAFGTRD